MRDYYSSVFVRFFTLQSLPLWSLALLIYIEIIAGIYLVSLAWFWSLCRASAVRERNQARPLKTVTAHKSNVIPFERAHTLRNRSRAV